MPVPDKTSWTHSPASPQNHAAPKETAHSDTTALLQVNKPRPHRRAPPAAASRVSACSEHPAARGRRVNFRQRLWTCPGLGNCTDGDCSSGNSLLQHQFSVSDTFQKDALMCPPPSPDPPWGSPEPGSAPAQSTCVRASVGGSERQRGDKEKASSCNWEDADESGGLDRDETAIPVLGEVAWSSPRALSY